MNFTSRRVVGFVAVTATLSLGLAGCSNSDTTATGSSSVSTSSVPSTTSATTTEAAPTASAILAKAKANALAAKTGTARGQITERGETMKIDFQGTNDGSTSDIRADLGPKGKVHLVSVGGSIYMQADAAFWKSEGAPAIVQKAGDKFIKAPAAETALAKEITINAFLTEALGQLTPDKISDEVGEATVDGKDCWIVTDKRGTQEGAIYVSKDAYQLVRFTGSTATPGQVDFSGWNEDLTISAPPQDQIFNLG